MKQIKIKQGEAIPPFASIIKEVREITDTEIREGNHHREYEVNIYETFIYLLVPEEKDFKFLREKLRGV